MVFKWEHHHSHHRKHFQWPGNGVWGISDEKYFHRISNSYLKAYFLLDSLENFMLFRSKLARFMRIHHDSTDRTYENHRIFWWNHAKIMTQNRSWKLDENIFHQKCPKQHSLVTESVSGDDCDDVPIRKPWKNHAFSHQSGTVGLSIVNHAYHVHDRTLHGGARRPVNFEVMVFED